MCQISSPELNTRQVIKFLVVHYHILPDNDHQYVLPSDPIEVLQGSSVVKMIAGLLAKSRNEKKLPEYLLSMAMNPIRQRSD